MYKGLQAHIKEINPLVVVFRVLKTLLKWVVHCQVKNLFNFCAKSTARWKVVKGGLQPNANKCIETLKQSVSIYMGCIWICHTGSTH